jgi:hypothetical protein
MLAGRAQCGCQAERIGAVRVETGRAIHDQPKGLDLEQLDAEAVMEVPDREMLSVVSTGVLPTGVALAAGLLVDGQLHPMMASR